MLTSSLFCVNGVSTTARLDASLQTTTISRDFAARSQLFDGEFASLSAPLGEKTVSSPVVIRLADHVHDVAVGVDWLRSVTQHRPLLRSYIVFFTPDTSSQFFNKAVSSHCVGFQYTSGNSRAVFVPAQGSGAASCSRKTVSPQLDLFNDVLRSVPASSNVMIDNGPCFSSFTNCLFYVIYCRWVSSFPRSVFL
jgi:hypothetical protein